MNGIKKIFWMVVLLLVVCLTVLGFLLFPKAAAKENLEVVFLDVGQGDAIFIKTPSGKDVLIDGGPDSSVIEALGRHMPFYDRHIDTMILTHPHSDHVAGLVEVLKRFEVGEIWYTGAVHTSPDYMAWLREVENEEAVLKIIEQPEIFDIGENVSLQILYPQESFSGKIIEELNNSSIVAKLSYGKIDFLLTGDAESEVEEKLIASGEDLSAEILKVGHHGSLSSTGQEFLNFVDPQFAVIQVGEDNAFGHPAYRTIRNLEKAGIKIFRTDWYGDIVLSTDGTEINLQN